MENNNIPEPEKRIDLVAAWNRQKKGKPWYRRLSDHFKKKEQMPEPRLPGPSLEDRTTGDADKYPGIEPAGYVPLIQQFNAIKKKDTSKDKQPSFLEGLVIGALAVIVGTTVAVKYGPQIQSHFQGKRTYV
ncbi:MAG: hypothetical protein ABIJ21_05195 [Nanoarchaeota archaeon]